MPVFAAGDRVQVFNPGPMACGTVVEDADGQCERVSRSVGGNLEAVYVEWATGDRTWSQARLLRLVETARQRGLD